MMQIPTKSNDHMTRALFCDQSRTQRPLAFWSAGGRQERLWRIRNNLIF